MMVTNPRFWPDFLLAGSQTKAHGSEIMSHKSLIMFAFFWNRFVWLPTGIYEFHIINHHPISSPSFEWSFFCDKKQQINGLMEPIFTGTGYIPPPFACLHLTLVRSSHFQTLQVGESGDWKKRSRMVRVRQILNAMWKNVVWKVYWSIAIQQPWSCQLPVFVRTSPDLHDVDVDSYFFPGTQDWFEGKLFAEHL